MRDTVDKILNNEAMRLFEISKEKGLSPADLEHLNALINTYTNFVGSSKEDPPPEHQSTAQLLASLSPPAT